MKELRSVWKNVAEVSVKGAILAVRFGGINERKVKPEKLIEESLKETAWEVMEVRSAGFPKRAEDRQLLFRNSIRKLLKR